MLENFTAAVFSISDTENTESITSDCVSQICSFFTSLFFYVTIYLVYVTDFFICSFSQAGRVV